MKSPMTKDRNTAANKGLPQWRVQCFFESFVRNGSVVLLLNICAKNPPLRQAPNRCVQLIDSSPKI
jgi:hypothetical protein